MPTKRAAPPRPPYLKGSFDPNTLLSEVSGVPDFNFRWGDPKEKKGVKPPNKLRGKRRLIGHPNGAMRKLHHLFETFLRHQLEAMGDDGKWLRILPSATGCVKKSNPMKNSEKHTQGEFFYTTDFAHAYPSVDLDRLSLLLTFIFRHEEYSVHYSVDQFARNELAHFALRSDPLFPRMQSFVAFAFGGMHGKGLAVGGPLSPMLLNLYCEVFLDSRLRTFFFKKLDRKAPERTVTYTRYVDDLVFSRGIPIPFFMRQEIRQFIADAGFAVNHRKSTVRSRHMGTVFVTKVGMREDTDESEDAKPAILVFPQKKRRRIHGIIQSYLTKELWNDSPEVIRGIIAEFLHYYKCVVTPTRSDAKTFALCKEFERVSEPYRKDYKKKRKRR
jgi:hypothetical protein